MNLSSFFLYVPYQFLWRIHKIFSKKKQIDFFCGNIVDYVCFQNIHELMPEIRIVARNWKVKKQLRNYNVKASIYPNFPDVIIMARHLTRKYPVKKIKKIGMRHGAYHFKAMINSRKYNEFDVFFMTSSEEVKLAQDKGIISGVAIGYPKLDKALVGKIELEGLKKELNIDYLLPTIIFSATWDKKGYSAIDFWYKRLEELTKDYNVLVTVHPWISKQKIMEIKKTNKVIYIEDKNVLPYLMIADLMIGDTSSIIGEFCALDKPLVTFELPLVGRLTTEIQNMLEKISYRIKTFDELKEILPFALEHADTHKKERAYYNKIMFDELDGKASIRASMIIQEVIRDIK